MRQSKLARAIPLQDNVLVASTARNHGEHMLDVGNHHIQQVRPRCAEHTLDGWPKLLWLEDSLTRHTTRIRHLDKVREDILLLPCHMILRCMPPMFYSRTLAQISLK
jgi:hypothetical protein